MKNALSFLLVLALALVVYIYKSNQSPTRFAVTADTNVSAVPGLSKYVTQEEVNSFAFRYSDIHCDKESNSTLIPLRIALQNKDTAKVMAFLKEHNLSVDVKMVDKKTPLMYSAFYDDTNTTNELIKLGANVHKKDRYKLNALAYAISIGSANSVKLLLEKNLTMQETPVVQMYGAGKANFYEHIGNIVINKDDMQIYYDKTLTLFKCGEGRYGDGLEPFLYIVRSNLYDTAKVILESGYKPTECDFASNKYSADCYKNIAEYDNYKPMLELLLKYDVKGQPTKEQLKEGYERCFRLYEWYKVRWIDGDNINEKRPFYVDLPIRNLERYCTDENGTFKDTKEFIAYMNKQKKMDKLIDIGDTAKVILKNKSDSIYNKINTINKEKFIN